MDMELLKTTIKDSGITMVALSKKSGINRFTLYGRLRGKGEFKVSEARKLSDILNLDEGTRNAIFFAD